MFARCLVCAAVVIGFTGLQRSSADEVFERPIRLEADGKVIDTGEALGHSSPCVEDVDGDGLADLIVGDFGGKFQIYKNVGEQGRPTYNAAGKIQAGGEDASVHIYCCVGGQPRFADLDGDGIRDMVSSSYDPGHCYLFRGLADHKFASKTELLDKSGVPVRFAPVQMQNYQSFGSFFAPVDWEADGDIDMLIGAFDGKLLLRVNEGDSKQAAFATDNKSVLASGSPLEVERHCCPVVADWDGDGLWDILAGSDAGSVTWFRNTGTKESPLFERGIMLVKAAAANGGNRLYWSDSQIVPGIRSQIEVVDHNGDGKLDLLVGDFYTSYEPRKDLDETARKRVTDLISERMELSKKLADKQLALQKEFYERYPGDAIFSDAADKEWTKAYQALKSGAEYTAMKKSESQFVQQLRPLLATTRKGGDDAYSLSTAHGHVWLFIRK